MIVAARSSDNATLDSVSLSSSRLKNSKYWALTPSRLIPTISYVSPSISVIMRASTLSVITRSRSDSGIDSSLRPLVGGDQSPFHCRTNGPVPLLSNASVTVAIVALSTLQPAVDEPRVAVRLGDARPVALARQVGPDEPVGGEGEEGGEAEGAEREDQQDPPAQPERAGTAGEQAEPAAPAAARGGVGRGLGRSGRRACGAGRWRLLGCVGDDVAQDVSWSR